MRFEPISPFGVVASDYTLAELADPSVQARLVDAWHDAGGLLVLRGTLLSPSELVEAGKIFGRVENMVETKMRPEAIMETHPEIFLVHNVDFSRAVPPRPEAGDHVLRYPERKGWHSDQSYRKPPPDASILYCVTPAAPGQGDTLFCDNAAAYESLAADAQAQVDGVVMLHAAGNMGRGEAAVRANPGVGAPPTEYAQSQAEFLQSVAIPAVRTHPATGKRALYLGTSGQSDWLEGPVVGMEPGPDGAGGRYNAELIRHATKEEGVVRHEWQPGDAVLYDNRVLMHAATWFDKELARREMWRLTIHTPAGPGPELAGERPSWEGGAGNAKL